MTPDGGAGAAGGMGSSTGLAPNIAGLLCYLLMLLTCGIPVAGIIFLVIEKHHPDVRFHAWQSIVLFGAAVIASLLCNILGLLPIVGIVFRLCFGVTVLGSIAAWGYCMAKAYQGERWKIPYLGDIVAKQVGV